MMKRSLGFSILGIFALLTLMSLVSATVTFSNIPTFEKATGNRTATITIQSDVNETITFTGLSPIIKDGKTITFSPINNLVIIDAPNPHTVTISYNVPDEFFFENSLKQNYSTTLIATGTSSSAVSQILSFQSSPNEYADNGNLNIDDVDLSVTKGFGDDTEWYPLDKIEVNVDVSNDGSKEIRNIVIEWGLYDMQNSKWVVDGEEDDFNLDEHDGKTVDFSFTLDRLNRIENNGDYIFYVWTTGYDKETDNKTSTFSSKSIDIILDNHFVVLDSLKVVGTPSCGDEVQITGEVWNIGEDDENDVYLKVFNTELGISKTVTVGDIDSLESKDLLFNVAIPNDAEDGRTYDLTFLVYDESDDIFENSNGDEAEFTVPLTIESGSCSTVPLVSVSANLESEAKAGEDFTVRATITNTATTRKTFSLELSDYSDWASLVSIDKTSLVLNAGDSQDVLIKLKANENMRGEHTFNIVMREGNKILTQPVSVSVAGKGFNLTGLFTGFGEGNTYLWVIGALNVILVLIIIIVAVRVVRKK